MDIRNVNSVNFTHLSAWSKAIDKVKRLRIDSVAMDVEERGVSIIIFFEGKSQITKLFRIRLNGLAEDILSESSFSQKSSTTMRL